MLLWLSLLLCSGACWAEQMYGACSGQYFSSSVNNNYDISGIQVSFGSIGIMKGFRLKFGNAWSPWYGVNGGTTQEIVLWPNEHIVAVSGSQKAFVRSLAFHTDQNRVLRFGTESGIAFMAYADSYGKILTGIVGQKRPLGICGIGFTWDYPLVMPNTNTTEVSSTQAPEQTTISTTESTT